MRTGRPVRSVEVSLGGTGSTMNENQIVPSNSTFELDDTNTEDEVLVEFQRLVSGHVNGSECFDGFIITPTLTHLRHSQSDHSRKIEIAES